MLSCAPPSDARERRQNLVGRERKLPDAHAARVEDGVRQRADRGDDGRLADADDGLALVLVVDERHQLRHLQRAGQLVIAEAGVELHAELRVHHATLVERHAERLNHAAVDLALQREPVERQAHVLHVNHLDGPHVPGLDIALDLGEADAVDAARRQARLPLAARRDARRRQRRASLLPRERLAAAAHSPALELDLFGLRAAEQRRDLLGPGEPRLVRRVLDRRRERSRRGRAARRVGLPEPRIADALDHIFYPQPELFGDDGARVGARARPQILRADGDHDRAVARDGDIDLALVVAAAAPRPDRAAEAPLERPRPRARRLVAPLPADLSGTAVELTVIHRVLQIPFAKLDGVEADSVREVVDQALDGVARLRVAGRTHRARRVFVRVDGDALAVGFGDGIDVGLARLRAVAEAADLVLRRVQGDELAVARHARLELLPRAGAVAREHELVRARQHQFDRRLRLLRELAGEHPFDADAELRPEAAAHVFDDGGDGALPQAEFFGRVAGDGERPLRRGVDGRRTAAAVVNDVAVRFERRVVDDRRAVLRLVNHVRRRQRRRDLRRIAALVLRLKVAFGVDLRRALLQRVVGADDVRQHFVLDADGANRVARDLGRVRRDRRDRLA